jgi:hypothetical protein
MDEENELRRILREMTPAARAQVRKALDAADAADGRTRPRLQIPERLAKSRSDPRPDSLEGLEGLELMKALLHQSRAKGCLG